MPGKSINQQQVNLYMSYRKSPKYSQLNAAAKAGFSERTARRIDKCEHQPKPKIRQYRTRKDPFNGLFEEYLVPLLEENPALQPITLLEVLDEKASTQFDHSHLRTLQRRVKKWRAKYGPDQEVIFLQKHMPGDMGISDIHDQIFKFIISEVLVMHNLVSVFCHVDDFCDKFMPVFEKKLITDGTRKRRRKSRMSMSECMTIVIAFHQSNYRDFKNFYLGHVSMYWKKYFPTLLS